MNIFKMERRSGWPDIVLWLGLYLFWILVFQKRTFAFSRTMTVEFCYLLFIAGNYYFNIYFTIPKFLYRKQYLAFAASMLAGIVAGALLRVPLAAYLNKHYFIPGKPQPGFSELFFNSFINIFFWVVCFVTIKLIADRIRFQKYVDVIEKEKSKSELDFLNAQFNPHFLFNSINSIYGHIDKTNSTARNMLLTFSDMLRYQLYDCNTDSVSIDKEINYIRNYVALQQSRKEENLVIRFFVDENVKGFTIAPLLFIAFIENAFKYVSSNDGKENKIEISFKKENDALVFTTLNTKDINGTIKMHHKGIGIANAKRRLGLLYPQKHFLDIINDEQLYRVKLKLELA
jgi:two-component system LytT family sensor kinase